MLLPPKSLRLSEAELAALAVEASHPAMPPDRLRELSVWHSYAPLRHAIIAHPNTPAETLLDLAALCRDLPTASTYLDALFTNPVAPLLLLEVPDFADRLNRRILLRMLRHGGTPPPSCEYWQTVPTLSSRGLQHGISRSPGNWTRTGRSGRTIRWRN